MGLQRQGPAGGTNSVRSAITSTNPRRAAMGVSPVRTREAPGFYGVAAGQLTAPESTPAAVQGGLTGFKLGGVTGAIFGAGTALVAEEAAAYLERTFGINVPGLGLSKAEVVRLARSRGFSARRHRRQGLFNKRALKTMRKAGRYLKQISDARKLKHKMKRFGRFRKKARR